MRTDPIWPSNQTAPLTTQFENAERTSLDPALTTVEPIPLAAWQMIPRGPTGQVAEGMAGSAVTITGWLSAGGAGAEEEIDERRRRPDQQGGEARDEDGAAADEGLVVVLRVRAERPGGGADDQADQGEDQRPAPDPVGQLLEGPAPGEL